MAGVLRFCFYFEVLNDVIRLVLIFVVNLLVVG